MAVTTLDLPTTTNIEQFLKQKDNKYIFTGTSMEIHIPKRYMVYDLLSISDIVHTLGVVRIVVNGNLSINFSVLNMITICPSDMEEITIGDVPYVVLYLEKGDVFIDNKYVVRTTSTVYALWVEFIQRGNYLYSLYYTDIPRLFNNIVYLTGDNLGMDRALMELVVAFLTRDSTNTAIQYRFTNMKKPPTFVPLSSVRTTPDSTMSRIIGSYAADGIVAALLSKETTNSEFEDLYRGYYDPTRPLDPKDSIVGE